MRYTVRYIPLGKIKPGLSVRMTARIMELRRAAQDCMHLMIVRKSWKAGGYTVVSGARNLDYLRRHTTKKTAPCLVDESRAASGLADLFHLFTAKKPPEETPFAKTKRRSPGSWSIIRSFMKREPRFGQLSRSQQLKVLRLGLQYKKTTISAMQAKVDALLRKP